MARNDKVKARLPRGFVDRAQGDIAATRRMIATIQEVYERYGFEPVETPAIEFTEALGKFLPDQDRPNEGVFSFQDDDEQWLSLRYDLTAPLARYFAENYEALPKPYRSYRAGYVFRNEKPGPGRFRQFMQFDADTVGSASPAADAEMCMMAADAIEALGVPRGDYVIKVNNRKILDGVMQSIGLSGEENFGRRLTVLRAIDKLDKFGVNGVKLLLGEGRKDESGDFTKGAGLDASQSDIVLATLNARVLGGSKPQAFFSDIPGLLHNEIVHDALNELWQIDALCSGSGYDGRVRIDLSVVRGLEYYTGAVFEADLTFEVKDEKGRPIRFGSVGGGGRYDGLVSRFRNEPAPATGFSIGVSRLQAALTALGKFEGETTHGPVVVTIFDKDHTAGYQRMVKALRDAGIRAELYLGNPKSMGNQLKYADRRNAPCVIIQGSNERDMKKVQIKDLIEGKKAAATIASNEEWRAARPAQFEADAAEPDLSDMVAAVKTLLDQHGIPHG